MDLPIEVINAVKPTAKPKARKPALKKITSRILQAIGKGLRTSTAIAHELGVPRTNVQTNLWNMKHRGIVNSTKQQGKLEHKYHLATGTPKKKARKPYTKQVANVANVAKPEIRRETNEEVQLKQRLSSLELTLVEKEKEVWTLECELFDKKAVITYLEGKLFALGVR
jgi:DNA-binding IclR family transcriptional regulator